ncbi:O-antigen ligase family protein [Paraglaciecola marina]|uniref:O-antigen ligase family protein n=1 Tax=Paraglaciecola marina TaxID=2500157 RepID=UPI00105EC9F0|nr:O-antigen ligase family protein [Paraglaciecola marina]
MISVLMFYGTFIACIALAFRKSAVFIFVLYQGVYFFNPATKWWGKSIPDLSYSFYIVLSLILIVMMNFSKIIENNPLKVPQLRWLYIVVLLYVIASVYAVLPVPHSIAVEAFVTLAVIVSLGYILCDTEKKLDYLIYGYLYGAFYLSFYVFQFGRNSGSRVEGVGMVDAPDSNGVSAALAPAVVLCLYYFWVNSNVKIKALFAITGVFVANALILINSRGAFLGVSVGLSVFIWSMYFSSFQRKNQKLTVIAIVILGLAGSTVIIDDGFIKRMQTLMVETEVDEEKESGATRTAYWVAAIEMSKDYPFGAGRAGFNYYAPVYIPENINTGNSKHRSVHSTWFETLSEIGYPGIIAFMMMLWGAYKTTQAAKKKLKGVGNVDAYFKILAIQCALITFIVTMTFLNRLRAEVLYWIILYTACVYNVYILKPQETKNANPE